MKHRRVKAAIGALFLAAAVAAGVLKSRRAPQREFTPESLVSEIGALDGVTGVLSVVFDGVEYNGQKAGRIIAVDLVARPGAAGGVLAASMETAGKIVREAALVYQKVVVTVYRSERDFHAGLCFLSRGLWLSPEYAGEGEGWVLLRLPDEKVPAATALAGIYSGAAVTCSGGDLEAAIQLSRQRPRYPTADIREILAAPFLDTFDHDDVFERSADLRSVDISLFDGERLLARFSITRSAYEGVDVGALEAQLSETALAAAAEEMKVAEKYAQRNIFTPLLFDSVVEGEDRRALEVQRARRREALDRFYDGLFGRGRWQAGGGR